jgi:biopolymer transport protein ExbB
MSDINWTEAILSSHICLLLVAFSVITVGIAMERFVYFWNRRGNPDATLARALECVRKGRIGEAISACEATHHPFGSVASQLLSGGRIDGSIGEEKLQVALSEQKLLLERNLGTLGTMAAVPPLMGLLGTVWGIMRSFHDMAVTGSAAPSIVAAGVAEALIATAMGLVVAVPALIIYNTLARRMNTTLTVAENHARTLRLAVLETNDDEVSEEYERSDDRREQGNGPRNTSRRRDRSGEPALSR